MRRLWGEGPVVETEIVPPVKAPALEHAWSREEPETEPLEESWGKAWSVVAVFLMGAVVIVMAIAGWSLLRSSHPSQSADGRVSNATKRPVHASTGATNHQHVDGGCPSTAHNDDRYPPAPPATAGNGDSGSRPTITTAPTGRLDASPTRHLHV